MWFVEALAGRGHAVVAVARSEQSSYLGLRAERLARVGRCCRTLWSAPFGSPQFLEILYDEAPIDILCHHAAETADYQSRDFDCAAAVHANTLSLVATLRALCAVSCRRIVLTGSVFEAGEGAGTLPLRALNAYGLSKTLTAELFSFYAEQEGLAFGKFVIANPFGPYEEARFTDYLIRSWRDDKVAVVRTPRYVRDNIHVSLLTRWYCAFAEALPNTGMSRIGPSGYVESQGAFADRFAREIGDRLKLETRLKYVPQREFDEPAIRINMDLAHAKVDWNESDSWDDLANYYARRFDISRR